MQTKFIGFGGLGWLCASLLFFLSWGTDIHMVLIGIMHLFEAPFVSCNTVYVHIRVIGDL